MTRLHTVMVNNSVYTWHMRAGGWDVFTRRVVHAMLCDTDADNNPDITRLCCV